MKALVVILLVLGFISWGCRKDNLAPTEPECLFVENDTTSLGQYAVKMNFYYDNDKRLVGRALFEDVPYPQLGITLYLPAFDSVVYVSNSKVITYHYPFAVGATNTSFNKDIIPLHSTVYSRKTEYSYQNNRLFRIDYFDKNSILLSDSLVYEGDKLVKIYKYGTIELSNQSPGSQKISTLDYEGTNLKSVVGVTKDRIGKIIGRDTTLYVSYFNLKNPHKKMIYLSDYFIDAISTNMWENIVYNFHAYNSNTNSFFPYTSGYVTYRYSDNGKGYPKEKGLYKCD